MFLANLSDMKRLLSAWLIVIMSLPALAQTVVSGKVTDTAGDPVENVIVRLLDGKKIAAYAMSRPDGTYSVKTASKADSLTLTAERLSFEKYSRRIVNRTSTADVVLNPKSTELREVTVSAPMIYVRGDTLTFRLDAFKGKEDISLKDAMKKIPGIEIAADGEIKYNGKAIKHFYIEGMDMLGGKYNIATDNIPANYVQAVQVLNNHKDAKIDKDEMSDDVAINIKLEPWAKFRPMGTYEASAGWGDRALYRVGGAGMMFNKKFQAMLTARIGNIEEFAQSQVRVFVESGYQGASRLESVLGKLSASQPPIEGRRYIHPDDRSVTLNLLNNKEDVTVRTNASYTYSKDRYEYSTVGRYFDGDGELVIDQLMSPESRVHKPELSVEYNLNSDRQYLLNRLNAKASFFEAGLPVLRSGDHIAQKEKMTTFGITDNFSTRWKRGRFTWGLHSDFDYQGGPEGRIDVSRAAAADNTLLQTARTSQFSTNHVLSMNYKRLNTDLYLPVRVRYAGEHIETHLVHSLAGDSRNDVNGNDFEIAATPAFTYTHPRKVIKVRADAGLRGRFFSYRNLGSVAAEQKSAKFTVNPGLDIDWNMNARSGLMARVDFNNSIGDILDMLTAPVSTDYLSVNARSGIISESEAMSAYARYDYKRPVEMLFFNATVRHTRSRVNLLTAQSVEDDIIGDYTVDRPAHGRNTSLSATVTKQIQSVRTKVSLCGSYTFGRNEMFQSDEVIPYDNSGYTAGMSLYTAPVALMSFDYDVNFSKSRSSYLDVKRSFWTLSQSARLNFFLDCGLSFGAGTDMSWRELAADNIKFIALLDADASYTFRSWRFAARVDNLLDSRHYAYTVFTGLNSFTYDYRLRGREFILSITCTM